MCNNDGNYSFANIYEHIKYSNYFTVGHGLSRNIFFRAIRQGKDAAPWNTNNHTQNENKVSLWLWHNVNPLKTKLISFIQGLSPYRAVNTLHFGYKNQSLNVL
jgi:hypothetical protein